MKRLIYFLPFIFLTPTPAIAREIRGIVLSAKDSVAVAGAECRLLRDSSTFLTGCTTDTEGKFSLDTDWKENATLTVSFPGYTLTTVHIGNGSHSLDVGALYLDDSTVLEEVTVTAEAVIQSKGRTIIYPSGADVRASSTALALFQKLPLPGLDANPVQRTLSVDRGTPIILINGVPSTLEDFNALQPKDIEKVEYSRFTPARYADKGGTGFINITLKKRNDGGQVYLWGRSALNTAFVDANLQASYHQGPSQFAIRYNPSWRNYQDVYDHVTESYIGDGFRVDLRRDDRNPFWYVMNGMQLKYIYSPGIRTLFSASFNANPYDTKRRAEGEGYDSAQGDYSMENYSKSVTFSPSLDLFLRHDFDESNTLEAQVVGTLSKDSYSRDNRYIYSGGAEESYLVNADARRRSLISEISYMHGFSDNLQLSAGYQNTVSRSSNKYLTSDYEPVLTENNNYIYARLGWMIRKVYLSLSTGAKLYWTSNDDVRRHFIRNLSRAYASWAISQKWNVSLNLNYNSGIPSLASLTDYAQQVSPYLISNGNPDLKSTSSYSMSLSPSYTYKKFTGSLFVSYNRINNAVISDVSYIGDGLFLQQSVNTKCLWSGYAGVNLKISGIAGFGANLSAGVSRYETILKDRTSHLTSVDGSLSLWWNKGPFTISYWRKLPGKYMSGYTVGKEENGDALQFSYQPDKHWNFTASWMYMFDKKGTRYPSWSSSPVNPSHTDRYIENNSNMICLSVSYSADFGSIFRTARRNLNNSDNGSSLLKM